MWDTAVDPRGYCGSAVGSVLILGKVTQVTKILKKSTRRILWPIYNQLIIFSAHFTPSCSLKVRKEYCHLVMALLWAVYPDQRRALAARDSLTGRVRSSYTVAGICAEWEHAVRFRMSDELEVSPLALMMDGLA